MLARRSTLGLVATLALLAPPTGRTWDEALGTFVGDTVKVPGRPERSRVLIDRLDWARA